MKLFHKQLFITAVYIILFSEKQKIETQHVPFDSILSLKYILETVIRKNDSKIPVQSYPVII